MHRAERLWPALMGITILLALPGCGGGSAVTPSDATRTITGTVTDATTSLAIAGAVVAIASEGLSATTGADGTYSLANVPSTSVYMQFSATGYVSQTLQAAVGVTRLDAQLSPDMTGRATLTGRVTDYSGDAVASARVAVEGTTRAVQTDASGSYTLTLVPEGLRTIVASAGGFRTQRRSLSVSSRSVQAVNFKLDRAPDARALRGSVIDALTGEAIVGAIVRAGADTVLTDNDGHYMVTDVSGTVVAVTVSSEGYLTASANIRISGTDNVANFALIPTGSGGPPGPPG
ncbi:MAG TPA: carboxypeptidase regulatory-like domain-containing protein [Armatimonadota bacterium]|nr:carboxypeptidase regulatory-like domain-containing protein [Armatimonadota bacterium]